MSENTKLYKAIAEEETKDYLVSPGNLKPVIEGQSDFTNKIGTEFTSTRLKNRITPTFPTTDTLTLLFAKKILQPIKRDDNKQ
jgi:hypothetical protein